MQRLILWCLVCPLRLAELWGPASGDVFCVVVAVQDYPEHRLQFFNLLHAITKHCFTTLFTMSPAQLKLVIDSIVWCAFYAQQLHRCSNSAISLL